MECIHTAVRDGCGFLLLFLLFTAAEPAAVLLAAGQRNMDKKPEPSGRPAFLSDGKGCPIEQKPSGGCALF